MDSLTTAAAHSLSMVWALVLNFLVFLVLTALLFFLGNRNKGSLIALIASFYVAFAIYTVFPFMKTLLSGTNALNEGIAAILVYAIFTGICFYVLNRSVVGGFFSMGNAGVIILAALTAGFLIALSYHSFSVAEIYTFPAAIKTYFAPAQYFFWWFIAPLVGLLIVAR